MRSIKSIERKRKRRNRKITFVVCVTIAVAVVIGFIYYGYGDVYRNVTEFKSFADEYFEAAHLYDISVSERTDYHYSEDYSYAIDYSACKDIKATLFRDKEIDKILHEYSSELPIAEDEKSIKRAILLRASVYETDNGVINMSIHRSDAVEESRQMEIIFEDIYTYQLSKKTGDRLVSPQVFVEDYRNYCYDFFKEYYITNYGLDELAEGWEENLSPTEENYNDYIVTEAGVTFFFEDGKILKDTSNIACAGIPALQAEPILRDRIIERYIDPNKPMVALTYDDGPGGNSEDRILNCLENNNAVATFFYQGIFIDGREEKIARAKKIGCEIGHHTWNHPVLTSLDEKEVKAQFDKTNKAIYDACGEYPTVFRPSYGETDSKINKMSKMPVILWSIDTVDWESRNGKKVFNLVKKKGNLDGDVILLHSIHNSTADATELLIPWLKEKGYQLVTVSELIEYKTGKKPIPGKLYRSYK